jgi:hypothetical protein
MVLKWPILNNPSMSVEERFWIPIRDEGVARCWWKSCYQLARWMKSNFLETLDFSLAHDRQDELGKILRK